MNWRIPRTPTRRPVVQIADLKSLIDANAVAPSSFDHFSSNSRLYGSPRFIAA